MWSAQVTGRTVVMHKGEQRTVRCQQCRTDFSVTVKRGRDVRFCSDFCRTKRRHQSARALPLCTTEGCRNSRKSKNGLCGSCYSRRRRTGTTAAPSYKYRSLGSSGYVRVMDKGHPLSNPNGHIYEHRKVLFNAIGEGPHRCHWCATEVAWVKGRCVPVPCVQRSSRPVPLVADEARHQGPVHSVHL